jgi:hypothetical protein
VARNSSTFTFKFTGRDDSVGSTLGGLERKMGGFGGFVDRWGGRIAAGFAAGFAVDKIVSVGSALFDLGNQLTTWEVKTDTVFGDQAESVRRWADDVNESLGLSDEAVAGLAASMGDLLVPLGATREQAAEQSTQLIELSGALSAWSGGMYDASQVSEILTKAQLGERDSLKALGISINQAEVDQRALTVAKEDGRDAVTELDKALATSQLILEKSTDAQAAWNDGSLDSIKNQNKLRAAWDDLKTALAERFMPAAERFTGWLAEDAVPALERFGEWVGPKIRGALDRLGEWWDENGPKIVGFLDDIWEGAKETWGGFSDLLEQEVGPALEFVRGGIDDLKGSTDGLSASVGADTDAWRLLGQVLGGAVVVQLYLTGGVIRGVAAAVELLTDNVRVQVDNFRTLVGWGESLKRKFDEIAESFERLRQKIANGIPRPGVPDVGGFNPLDLLPNIPFFADGGFVTSPTLSVVGEGGQPEFIFNAEQMRGLAAHGISLGSRSNTATTPAPNVNVYVAGSVLSDRDLADVVNRATRRGLIDPELF